MNHADNKDALIIETGREGDYKNGGYKYTSKTVIYLTTESPTIYDIVPLNFGKVETEAAPKPKQAPAWINKARSKDQARPQLCRQWGDFAADGFRVHLDASLPPVNSYGTDGEYDFIEGASLRKSVNELPDASLEYDNLVTISPKMMSKAIKGMSRLAKNGAGYVKVSLNGNMDISASSEELGTAKTSLDMTDGYSYTGEDVSIAFNPAYMIDALAGFVGDEVIISFDNPNRPVYITDGSEREALIMPMDVKELETVFEVQ